MATSTLTKARQNKADEFYPQLPDIEAEMRHYRDQFKGTHDRSRPFGCATHDASAWQPGRL